MVKRIVIAYITIIIWFLASGQNNNDYYSRIDNLLSPTVSVMTNANALPIYTGALDGYRTTIDEKKYFQAAIKLADKKNNWAWAAHQNSKKRTLSYQTKKLNKIIQDKAGTGEIAAFLDKSSGARQQKKEQRYQKQQFFKNFQKGIGSADIYIENIGIATNELLEDLFEINTPEIPNTKDNNYNRIPQIKILPLKEWKNKIIRDITHKNILDQLQSIWKIVLSPIGNNIESIDNKIYKLTNDTTGRLGVKIIDPTGKVITKEENLKQYTPYLTTLPDETFANSNFAINIKQKNINNLSIQKVHKNNRTKKIKIVSKLENMDINSFPLTIEYTMPENIDIIKANIYNYRDQVIFSSTQSKPNPEKTLPIVWNGNIADTHGRQIKAKPGQYKIKIFGLDKNKNIIESISKKFKINSKKNRKKIFIKSYKIANNSNDNQYYGYIDITAINKRKQGLEKIYVWLHGTETSRWTKPISDAIYFTFNKFDNKHSFIKAENNKTIIGKYLKITVVLKDKYNKPIPKAKITLFSRRNINKRNIDQFKHNNTRTNQEGLAEIFFRSNIAGEAEIYAMSDLLWINTKPLIIKIRSSRYNY